ncbi:aldo/keto reductase [Nonomuraea phyllanthi]|uniref:aldo/keto reductase n=1 Tax=Nonomuraea phyllanthi TaxID=2219224 RepID=UPI001D142A53|nr:aldo/keto reductase [Nonomuraea phyllanthi]
MDYEHLGRSGLRVSRLCLGTMNFGDTTDEPTAFAIMDEALEAGINFVDTADVHGRPQSPDMEQGYEFPLPWKPRSGDSAGPIRLAFSDVSMSVFPCHPNHQCLDRSAKVHLRAPRRRCRRRTVAGVIGQTTARRRRRP